MKKFICCFLLVVMMFSMSSTAFATENPPEIDADVAATIAMMFVWTNIGDSVWSETTNIDSIIPLYNNEDEINGYCINLITNQNKTGYITVSTDLNEPLIQEYSDVATLVVETQNDPSASIDTVSRSLNRIYYYGPLSYSTSKHDSPNVYSSAEDKSNTDNFNNASAYIKYLLENGIFHYTSKDTRNVEISDPIVYLKERYPNHTIENLGYYNIGDSSVDGYKIDKWNACGEYGTAAILKYYLGSAYEYNSIADRCMTIARENGYATYDTNVRDWNYYIAIGDLAPFVNDCIADYGLSKNASSSLFSWSTGTSEISNNRPILLNIGYSEQYDDHTVTAYAWTEFYLPPAGTDYTVRFFKVKDGYELESRYVNYEKVVGSYITKVV